MASPSSAIFPARSCLHSMAAGASAGSQPRGPCCSGDRRQPRSARRERDRRSSPVGGRRVDHRTARHGLDARDEMGPGPPDASGAPHRAPVLPDDDDRGRDRRLERDLSPQPSRAERSRCLHRVHRVLARDGDRPARGRSPQRAARCRDAGAQRHGSRCPGSRRRAPRRRADPGGRGLHPGRARNRQCCAAALHRCWPHPACRPFPRGRFHRRLHGLHRRPAAHRHPR